MKMMRMSTTPAHAGDTVIALEGELFKDNHPRSRGGHGLRGATDLFQPFLCHVSSVSARRFTWSPSRAVSRFLGPRKAKMA
jgi:hypothetical protein